MSQENTASTISPTPSLREEWSNPNNNNTRRSTGSNHAFATSSSSGRAPPPQSTIKTSCSNDNNGITSHKASQITTTNYNNNSHKPVIHILSAKYGPSKNSLPSTTTTTAIAARPDDDNNTTNPPEEEVENIPLTRDVVPFLRALLVTSKANNTGTSKCYHADATTSCSSSEEDNQGINSQQPKNAITLMVGKSMNVVFGDPCPGITKRLDVEYVFCTIANCREVRHPPPPTNSNNHHQQQHVCLGSFAEHERVELRRQSRIYNRGAKILKKNMGCSSSSKTNNCNGGNSACRYKSDDVGVKKNDINRTHRINTTTTTTRNGNNVKNGVLCSGSSSLVTNTTATNHQESTTPLKYTLHPSIWETIIPILLPYLTIKQRVQCQLICTTWKRVIIQWGVAQYVDINDPSIFNHHSSKHTSSSNITTTNTNTTPSSSNHSTTTTTSKQLLLRGVISNSYPSLQYLYLTNYTDLSPIDFHNAIPQLQQLRNLDISNCIHLTNQTLLLLSQHLHDTLEVLYMKGLRNVSDEGLISISQTCLKLRVLEISNVRITDDSGLSIGYNLRKLEALYMKDNYLLTNTSIDVITKKCTKLTQLTLWGCTKLIGLSFVDRYNKLVLLNLWGCHSVKDESVYSMRNLGDCLRILIVSECHRLTDFFVVNLAQLLPNITNLHLRYLRKLTDASIHAIASHMPNLYSLDLSFCIQFTSSSLIHLVESRKTTLSELKLYACSQLSKPMEHSGSGGASRRVRRNMMEHLVLAITAGTHTSTTTSSSSSGKNNRSGASALCILDVRECCGDHPTTTTLLETHIVQALQNTMGFRQPLPGFFVRDAIWNEEVEKRLVGQLVRDCGGVAATGNSDGCF